jgi:hypothetical protein
MAAYGSPSLYEQLVVTSPCSAKGLQVTLQPISSISSCFWSGSPICLLAHPSYPCMLARHLVPRCLCPLAPAPYPPALAGRTR